jgi:hypothetical protein
MKRGVLSIVKSFYHSVRVAVLRSGMEKEGRGKGKRKGKGDGKIKGKSKGKGGEKTKGREMKGNLT